MERCYQWKIIVLATPSSSWVFLFCFCFICLFVFVTSAKAEVTEGRKITKTTLLLWNYYLVCVCVCCFSPLIVSSFEIMEVSSSASKAIMMTFLCPGISTTSTCSKSCFHFIMVEKTSKSWDFYFPLSFLVSPSLIQLRVARP